MKNLNFNKNELINETLDKFYESFSHTLDTAEYVPKKYNDKICRYIFKNMKKAFKRIDKCDKEYQKGVNRNRQRSKKRLLKIFRRKSKNK